MFALSSLIIDNQNNIAHNDQGLIYSNLDRINDLIISLEKQLSLILKIL